MTIDAVSLNDDVERHAPLHGVATRAGRRRDPQHVSAWRELRLFFGLGIPRATRRALALERDEMAAEIEALAALL